MNQMTSIPPHLLADQQGVAYNGFAPPGDWKSDDSQPSELMTYWRAVMLRKWSILTLTVLISCVVAFIVSQVAPSYRSTATVLVESSRAKVVSIEDVYAGASANREYFQTQAEILKSRDVALRVTRQLKLAGRPEFDPRQDRPSAWRQWIGESDWVRQSFPALADFAVASPVVGAITETEAEAVALRRFADRLKVEPVRQSQLIKVSFESVDPVLAASVANAVASAYIQSDIDNRSSITQGAGLWINERLAELKIKLDASERALQTYREREGMLDNKTTVLGGTGRQLEELTQRLVEARVRRSEAEEALNQVRAGAASTYDSVPAVVRNPTVQRAKEIEADAQKRLAEVSERYGPEHPRYVSVNSEVTAARANTKHQMNVIVDSVVKEYDAARATEKNIEGALSQAKGAIQNLNRKEIQLGALEREATANRQIYQTFLARYKETNATSDAQQPNARVVDPATPALNPIRPQKARAVGLAAVAALLLGIVITLVLMRLDNTIKISEDVETKLGQPFLAALPKLAGKVRRHPTQAVTRDPHGVYSEAIRTVSTGVLLSALDVARKIVVVTSSVPGEGKSTFSINFALSQAKSKRALLIEGDLRRPSFATALGLPADQKGLSDLMTGAPMEDCLVTVPGTELHVIACGRIAPNPHEILVAHKFRELLTRLHANYDIIVFDTPPVQLVSDALIIGSLSTGMIYLVKADETPVPLAKAGLKRIAAANIPIFGVVINQQDYKKADRYYGQHSGYEQYGYGKTYSHPTHASA